MRSFLLLVQSLSCLAELSVEGNPHSSDSGTACCPAQRLAPETLLPFPTTLTTQRDTFVTTTEKKHGDVSATVFTFRQPARLSNLELPFDLALVADLDPRGIVEVPAPAKDAADSWFPDYSWDHWVVCAGTADAKPQHLGWRFMRKAGATGAGPTSFVALIVAAREREAEAEVAARVRVPVSVSTVLREDENEDEAEDEAAAEPHNLQVGVEAPGWMAAMVAAVTARAAHRSA